MKKKISESLKKDGMKNSKKTRKQKGKNFKIGKIDKILEKQAPEFQSPKEENPKEEGPKYKVEESDWKNIRNEDTIFTAIGLAFMALLYQMRNFIQEFKNTNLDTYHIIWFGICIFLIVIFLSAIIYRFIAIITDDIRLRWNSIRYLSLLSLTALILVVLSVIIRIYIYIIINLPPSVVEYIRNYISHSPNPSEGYGDIMMTIMGLLMFICLFISLFLFFFFEKKLVSLYINSRYYRILGMKHKCQTCGNTWVSVSEDKKKIKQNCPSCGYDNIITTI